MLYFKEDLVSLAKEIIDVKGTADDIKAFQDLTNIDNILNYYCQTNQYNSVYANDLDIRIRKDYPLIYELEQTPSNQTTQQGNVTGNGLPLEINKLNVDRYGIFYTILLKKGEISALKDFLK